MALPTANLIVSSDTWQTLIDKVNGLSYLFTTQTVTANLNANGSLTTGNGYVNGVFGATTLVASNVRGGTVQTSAALNITSNVSIANVNICVGNYVTSNVSTNQIADSYPITAFRSAKYLLQVNSAIGYQTTEILILQDGANTYQTEYAVLSTNGSLGTFSSNISSNNVNLLFSPTIAVNSVNFERITIPV